ncbi:MAG: 50S ribosomal protein L32 [Candidatus Binatia bacterium]|nr:MAG: 50S ribosomal protein L32 [Candidatus Binatia bacterium]
MAVPKRKTSKSKRNKRRAHDALTPPTVVLCPECGEPKLPHRVCAHCGSYKGRKVLDIGAD